jgi:ABC-2 type transport system ATP-binding protein
MTIALQLTHLTKTFGTHTAVNAIKLEVSQGMLYAFLGPNGASKSTILKMVSGLLKPDAGDALILGHSIQSNPRRPSKSSPMPPIRPCSTANSRRWNTWSLSAGCGGCHRPKPGLIRSIS